MIELNFDAGSKGPKIKPGIYEGWTFNGVKIDKYEDSGDTFIDFLFTTNEGEEFKQRFNDPTNKGFTSEDKRVSGYRAISANITHILQVVVPDIEKYASDLAAEEWADFFYNIEEVVNSNAIEEPVDLKIEYDYRGYPAISRIKPSIKRSSDDSVTLEMTPRDNVSQPIGTSTSASTGSTGDKDENSDDLPF